MDAYYGCFLVLKRYHLGLLQLITQLTLQRTQKRQNNCLTPPPPPEVNPRYIFFLKGSWFPLPSLILYSLEFQVSHHIFAKTYNI